MTDTIEAVRLADPIKPLADAPIVAWCIESTDSADWCWSATRDGVIDNAKFLDDGCAPGEPFAVIRQADHQAQMNALLRRIPELETARDVAVELAAQYAAERDRCHEWADQLASAIAEHTCHEIGEHTSANNPWRMALNALECHERQDTTHEAGARIKDLEAEAAQGEPFGFVHHYVAHDSQGRIIDSTWEADGCEDEMPHPTHPIKWRWERSEPFYTKPAAAQGAPDHDKAAAMVSWVAHSLSYLRERLSSSHDVDSLNRSIGELYQAHALLKQPPAQPAVAHGAGEVVAWCTPDGERCVTARTYEGARKDGGAMWSSMVPFTVPAYTQPATGAVVWQPMATAPSQKTVLLAVRNEYGRVRTVLARHVNRHTEAAGEDDQATEYRESDDTYYVSPGWYECNSEAEINYGIGGEFLGWTHAPKWAGAALSTHQQRQDGGAVAASGRQE